MSEYYSDYFNVPHSLFESKGIFDGLIGTDIKLHIDPLRLKGTQIEEFKDSYKNVFLKYFDRFVHFVDSIETENEDDTFFRLMVEHFRFDEIHNVGLGYSENGAPGKGINETLAKQLSRTTKKIIQSGMRDPELFMFMHLFEKNIGADRISDMTIHILQHQLLKYTERVAKEMNLDVRDYTIDESIYQVPYVNEEPLYFVPTSLLADLPDATSFDDISKVENYNNGIKRKVCKAVNGEWKDYTSAGYKQVMKNALLNSKQAYYDAINYYRGLTAQPYDFSTDPKHFYLEARIAEIVKNALKNESFSKKLTAEDVLAATREAVLLFKECVENHRSYKLMYYEKKHIAKSEDYAQELLFVISKAYLEAKGFDIDVSPEADTGLGKLDFKFSQGKNSRVVIETKLLTNSELLYGYQSQLPDYMKAQNAAYGLFVIVIVNSTKNQKRQIQQLRNLALKREEDSIMNEIIFVDAKEKSTASKKKK